MKVVVVLIVVLLLGTLSGFGYKFFLEEKFSKEPIQNIKSDQKSKPDKSGFAEESQVKNSTATVTVQPTSVQPDVSISTRSDKKAIILTFEKLKGVAKIEYIVQYEAGITNRGIRGELAPKPTDTLLTREIILGTCSGVVCTYDQGVATIDVSVVFDLENGKEIKVDKTHLVN